MNRESHIEKQTVVSRLGLQERKLNTPRSGSRARFESQRTGDRGNGLSVIWKQSPVPAIAWEKGTARDQGRGGQL